jgi:hypothetical protein
MHLTCAWQRTSDMKLDQLGYGPNRVARPMGLTATVAFMIGGLLVVWTTYIHFHLWQDLGYRHISVIGPLFLLQSIAGLLIGLLVILVCRVWVAIIGIGFAFSTMIGFFISIEYGLFGFKDSWAAPFAHQALAIEIATMIVLIAAGALCLTRSASTTRAESIPAGIPSSGA